MTQPNQPQKSPADPGHPPKSGDQPQPQQAPAPGDAARTPRPDTVQKSPADPDRKADPSDFTTVERDVGNNTDAKSSVAILVQQIADRFAAVKNDPNKVQQLADQLKQQHVADRFAAAVVNNTDKDDAKDADGNPLPRAQPVKPVFTGAQGGTGAGGGSAGASAGATGANLPAGTVISDAGPVGTSESAKPRGPQNR